MLTTRVRRLAFVLIVLAVGAGALWGYLERPIYRLTDTFYVAVASEEVDITSPTKKRVVATVYKTPEILQEICPSATSTSLEYRGLIYCDPVGFRGSENSLRETYFREAVDAQYGQAFQTLAVATLFGGAMGLAIWLTVVVIWITGRWIWLGKAT